MSEVPLYTRSPNALAGIRGETEKGKSRVEFTLTLNTRL